MLGGCQIREPAEIFEARAVSIRVSCVIGMPVCSLDDMPVVALRVRQSTDIYGIAPLRRI
jgi:hypothetical protein